MFFSELKSYTFMYLNFESKIWVSRKKSIHIEPLKFDLKEVSQLIIKFIIYNYILQNHSKRFLDGTKFDIDSKYILYIFFSILKLTNKRTTPKNI